MAKPRVFISSTYFDLKHVRADLERFIREMGYDPILNERGSIAYGNLKKLEEYCYKEIELCDMLVSIIGGRYGSPSEYSPHSISQTELKTAVEMDKPVYIFIDRNVLSEYRTYQSNKGIKSMKYSFVDNVEVYKFIEDIEKLPKNNPITPFETSGDIIIFLKEQWAGLFQRLLKEQTRFQEVKVLDDIKSTSKILSQLVTFLTEERKKGDRAIGEILLSNHPIFQHLRKLLKVSYRVYFSNLDELNSWLLARALVPAPEDNDKMFEWINEKTTEVLKISKNVFDNERRLKVFTSNQWDNSYATLEKLDLGEDFTELND